MRLKYPILIGVLVVLLTISLGWNSVYPSVAAAHQADLIVRPSHGPLSGEVTAHSAVLWARATELNPTATLSFEVSSDPTFNTLVYAGDCVVSAATDFTGEVTLTRLQPHQSYFYRVFQDGDRPHARYGRFSTAPADDQAAPFSFTFGACLGGQGYCRDVYNGWKIFDAMGNTNPDFFVMIGDGVYVDDPCNDGSEEPVATADQESIPGQNFEATDLFSMRSRYKYHLEDPIYANFLSNTPVYVSWDDHEVVDNFVGTDPDPEMRSLIEAGRTAFFDYWPIQRQHGQDRIYRKFSYGALADFFILDNRSYRDGIDQPDSDQKTMLGSAQLAWLQREVAHSDAVWKFIVTSVPLSYTTGEFPDEPPYFRDGWASYPGEYGYETELGRLVDFLDQQQIQNVVFLTGDTHWPFAIRYDPDNDGVPNFYELASSPLSAVVLSPKDAPDNNGATGIVDPTFNPTVLYKPEQIPGVDFSNDRRFNFGQISLATNGQLTFNVVMQGSGINDAPAEQYAPVINDQLPITLMPTTHASGHRNNLGF